MHCYRHIRSKTAVSCGRCLRPICSDCMVSAPAGIRCRECASHRFLIAASINPERVAWAVSLGFAIALIGAVFMRSIGILAMALGPLYGFLVAETIGRVAGKSSRFTGYEYCGAAVIVAAVIVAGTKPFAAYAASYVPWPSQLAHFAVPIMGLSIGLAVSACYKRMRSAALAHEIRDGHDRSSR